MKQRKGRDGSRTSRVYTNGRKKKKTVFGLVRSKYTLKPQINGTIMLLYQISQKVSTSFKYNEQLFLYRSFCYSGGPVTSLPPI